MNKHNLIDQLSTNSNLTKTQLKDTVDQLLDAIGQTLTRGETVNLPGFGKFEPKTRAARTCDGSPTRLLA